MFVFFFVVVVVDLLGKQTSGAPSAYPCWSAAPDAAAMADADAASGLVASPAVEEASPVEPLSLPIMEKERERERETE